MILDDVIISGTGAAVVDAEIASDETTSKKTPASADGNGALESGDESGTREDDKENDRDEDGEDGEGDDEPKQPKRSKGVQKRITDLARERNAERQRREAAERELAELKAGKTSSEKPGEKKPAVSQEGKPVESDFDTYEQYIDAVTDWKLDKREQKRVEDERQASANAKQKELGDRWNAGVEELREKYDDADEVLDAEITLSDAAQRAVLRHAKSAELAYQIGKDAGFVKSLAGMDAYEQIVAIGEFAAEKLPRTKPGAPDKATKPSTKAPAPITPVSSRASTGTSKDPSEMTFEEYKAYRAKQR